MNTQKVTAGLFAAFCLAAGGKATAQGVVPQTVTAAQVTAGQITGQLTPVYVRDFQVAQAPVESPGLLVTRVRASRQAAKSAGNAAALSEAVIRELNTRGVPAHRLGGQAPPTQRGWLISGVFSESAPRGVLSSLSSLGSSASNTEVTVRVADMAADPHSAAVFGTSGALKGQGPSAAWNPYAVAVRFVVNQIESNASIDDLARKIVGEILAQQPQLADHVVASQDAGHPGERTHAKAHGWCIPMCIPVMDIPL
jgi:hypothetical protein